ncbi:hypothetical protein ACIREO_28765 [Streptomyces sp. NPDC102441]|uniref:hypothetical protein n=1 Tax=Streptomyces sp. NPDC102441 TaxID=3366176 RepID=UPI003811C45C
MGTPRRALSWTTAPDQASLLARADGPAGTGCRGRAGAADSHLFEAGEVLDFGLAWIEEKLSATRQ